MYEEKATTFSRYFVRDKIGRLHYRLGRSPVATKVSAILEAYEKTEDEHAAVFDLKPIARKAEGHRKAEVRSAAIALSNALESVESDPLYQG